MATSQTTARIVLALGLLLAVTLLVGYTLGFSPEARQVTIAADGQQVALEVRAATVEAALTEAKVVLGEHDRVSPELASKVQAQMEIVVTRVTKGEIVEHERIYFHEVRRANHNLERGVTRTVQRGREGRRAEHYEVVYEDGQRVSKTLLRTEVLEPKVDRIVEYGTIGSLSRGGNTYRFTRVFYVTATAYTAGPESTGKSPGHPAFGITRSGLPVEVGHIAVDPDLIPLLSHVWVEGLCAFSAQFNGRYFATDTGSAIQGNRIDIYFERVEDALRFGRRRMRVYVLAR
ncbi:MAG: Cell wall-binding protein YocH [Firmicutes bacterium]|nr:Cell wall-binding protein YocH [candidate division NPL-UPA2 bacterium]